MAQNGTLPERRVAPDGKAYTEGEFRGYFGGLNEWNRAAVLEVATGQAYPGSPLVAASQCRPQDALALCELAEDQHALLSAALERWTRERR